jgi:hypothetical protein
VSRLDPIASALGDRSLGDRDGSSGLAAIGGVAERAKADQHHRLGRGSGAAAFPRPELSNTSKPDGAMMKGSIEAKHEMLPAPDMLLASQLA